MPICAAYACDPFLNLNENNCIAKAIYTRPMKRTVTVRPPEVRHDPLAFPQVDLLPWKPPSHGQHIVNRSGHHAPGPRRNSGGRQAPKTQHNCRLPVGWVSMVFRGAAAHQWALRAQGYFLQLRHSSWTTITTVNWRKLSSNTKREMCVPYHHL